MNYYPHQNNWKFPLRIVFFQSNMRTCEITIPTGGLMLYDIIMEMFLKKVEQKINHVINIFVAKIKDDEIYLYQGSLQEYKFKKTITDINKTLRSHHFMKTNMQISGWSIIHCVWWSRYQKHNKSVDELY